MRISQHRMRASGSHPGRDDHSSLPFSNPFDPALWDGTPYLCLRAVINQLCRFAVPLFFLCASCFLQPALAAQVTHWRSRCATAALLGLWLAWSLLYLLVPFNPGRGGEGRLPARHGRPVADASWGSAQRLVGGRHDPPLWFLPALMVASADPGALPAGPPAETGLLLGACALRTGLIGGSLWPAAGGEWALLTRSGPLLLPALRGPGRRAAPAPWQPDARRCALMMVAGMGLYALEAAGLLHFRRRPLARHDFCWAPAPGRWGCSACCWPTRRGARTAGWSARRPRCSASTVCMMLVVWLMIFGPQGKLVVGTPQGARAAGAHPARLPAAGGHRPQPPVACGPLEAGSPASRSAWFSAKSCICWEQGSRATPSGLRAYSTLGGTSG